MDKQCIISGAKYISKNRFDGKVAVITGSSYGIGYSIAERLGLEGCKVVICSRKQENVDVALSKLKKQNIQAAGVQCHISNANDREKLYKKALEEFGGINIFVSNVGVNPKICPVLECQESEWDKTFDVNLKSPYLLAKEILPYIKRNNNGGKMLFISSISAFGNITEFGAYSVSKCALNALTKLIAGQLAEDNIQVNCIAPGLVDTPFADAIFKTARFYEQTINSTPMRRYAEPHEIAGVAAFLVSDDASYITGEIIVAAGGMSSRL
nr:dehydrogenase/reductase SDR family member 4-like isoform X2 [Onthophagus taurus]